MRLKTAAITITRTRTRTRIITITITITIAITIAITIPYKHYGEVQVVEEMIYDKEEVNQHSRIIPSEIE